MTEIAARRARVLPLLGLVLVALLIGQATHELFDLGGRDLATFFDQGVHNFLLGASAAACLARAVVVARGRMTWAMIGISLTSFLVGDLVWTLQYEGVSPVSFPTVADIFWLAYYPFVVAGLVFLTRDRIDGFDLHRWIDGMAAALIAITLGVIFLVNPVAEKYKGHGALATAVEFAYPVCDVLILGAVMGVFALTAWRPGKTWLLLGVGLLMFTIADSISAVQTLNEAYLTVSYDFVWTAAALLIACAAWMPYPARGRPAQLIGWKAVALPIACQVFAAAIQLLALFRHLPESERVLTVVILAIVTVQLWISRPRTPD